MSERSLAQRLALAARAARGLLGGRPGGFFIPYRYADQVPAAGTRAPYPAAEAVLAAALPEMTAALERWSAYRPQLEALGEGGGPEPRPRWNQDWFARLDALALYGLVRAHAPSRLIEIGSGHSTRFALQAVTDGGLATRVTSIDPAPRAPVTHPRLERIAATLEAAPQEVFTGLGPGDLLFIDSSHILMPGSDVDRLFNRVLPALAPGVLVHIHDVFLPDDYPAQWAWRGYNEQLGVLPLLIGGWRPLWSSHVMARQVLPEWVTALPLVAGALESSLWLEVPQRPRDQR